MRKKKAEIKAKIKELEAHLDKIRNVPDYMKSVRLEREFLQIHDRISVLEWVLGEQKDFWRR
jgi:hypothetical protein